jgi:hypothetical protein
MGRFYLEKTMWRTAETASSFLPQRDAAEVAALPWPV